MRFWSPDHAYFVTNRCEQERLFLLPRPKVLQLIGAWLAKSLEEHGDGIELYAFIFLSNHFHLLLRDTKGQLAEFMYYFQLNLAKSVNELLGRRGHFFARKYDAAPVLTDEDFENRWAYIATNAVKAGLVSSASSGPFFSSLEMALDGRPRSFEWTDRTALHNKSRRGQRVLREEVTLRYSLELSVPPQWRGLSERGRRARMKGLVKANEVRYGRERRAEGRSVLGARRVLQQSPLMRPRKPSRSPRVEVFCRDRELEAAHLEMKKQTAGLYREEFGAFLEAALMGRRASADWPPGTYPPSSLWPVGAPAAPC